MSLLVKPIPWSVTPDGFFHLQRTRALTEAFQAGIFYPRLFPDFAFAYGYPVFNYYAPLSYYPAALLHWWGLPLLPAVLMGLALFSAIAVWSAYHFFRHWTRPAIAFVGALLYLLLPYRFYDLFVRGALPEFAAFAWLPLVGLGMVKLLQQADRVTSLRELMRSKSLVVAVLGWSALILTHNLSALLALLAFGLAFSLFLLQGVMAGVGYALKRWLYCVPAFVLPILLGTGLAAFYVLPALLELDWVWLGQAQQTAGYVNHFVDFSDLFTWSFPYPYPPASAPTVPLPGAVAVILFLLVLLCLDRRAGRVRQAAILCLVIAICALWLLTSASRPLWDATAAVLGKLQFPWRWQVVLGFVTAWGATLVLQWIRDRYLQRAQVLLIIPLGALVAGAAFYTLGDLPHTDNILTPEMLTRRAMWEWDTANGQIGLTWVGEFTPQWMQEERWAVGRAPSDATTTNQAPLAPPVAHGGVAATAPQLTLLRKGYLTQQFRADFATPTRLIFHKFFWPAWRIEADGQVVQTFPVTNLGLLAVDLHAGQYLVTLRWQPTTTAVTGWTITGITWGVILLLLLRFHNGRRRLVGGWLLLGLVAIVGAFWPPREIAPTVVAAAFGAPPTGPAEVRLEAASAAPARAGAVAQVELSWLILNPQQPLTAFVHLIGPDGGVKAQHDGPLAGDYTPFERWLPGLLVERSHPLPIPPDLAPGVYELMAGVYRSGDANTVLMPLRVGEQHIAGESHRVRIGTIEVIP